MSKNYIHVGQTISVVNEGNVTVSTQIPVGIWHIVPPPMQAPMLAPADDFQLPAKIYGDLPNKVERVTNTYFDRPTVNTGVLLAGMKGSGKTLMARLIIQAMLDKGIPAIVVPFSQVSPAICEFLQSIDCQCVVVFDEIDKIAKSDDSSDKDAFNSMLSLLDGISAQRKLFILTVNEEDRLSQYLFNRPGRLYYRFLFNSLTNDQIRSYCEDKLLPECQQYIPFIMKVAVMVEDINFDMLQCIVEETNRYKQSPQEFIADLNIISDPEGSYALRAYDEDGTQIQIYHGYDMACKVATEEAFRFIRTAENTELLDSLYTTVSYLAGSNKPEYDDDPDVFSGMSKMLTSALIEPTKVYIEADDQGDDRGFMAFMAPKCIVNEAIERLKVFCNLPKAMREDVLEARKLENEIRDLIYKFGSKKARIRFNNITGTLDDGSFVWEISVPSGKTIKILGKRFTYKQAVFTNLNAL